MGIEDKIKKIRKLGLKKSVEMIGVKWKKKELDFFKPVSNKEKRNIDYIFRKKYRNIIIFENHFGYYNIMLQRPQHMMRNLGDDQTLAIYNSYYSVDYQDRSRITRIGDSVYIMDLHYYRDYLIQVAEKMERKYLMIYSTDTIPMSRIKRYETKGFKVIYEYVDDINPDLISPKKIRLIMERHNYLIKKKKALVVTTATQLYENVKRIDDEANVVLITNGAECDKFQPGHPVKDETYCEWLREDSIKVGYYGALASWVDYELLKK